MYDKLVVLFCAAAFASAGYIGPPTYGYDPSSSSPSYKSQPGTFGPVASNSGVKPYTGPTLSQVSAPVPGAFTATTKNGNPVSYPSYPAVQYSTPKGNALSYSYTTAEATYPNQNAGVTDYPASYSPQAYNQYPQVPQVTSQTYPQPLPQTYPQSYPQAQPQAYIQAYTYPSQESYPGYQAQAAPQYQAYPVPNQYQALPPPVQYQATAPTQYQAYPSSAQYPGYPSVYSGVQQSSAPVQYSSAPAVSHVQYSSPGGSYSWKI